jgi:diaminopimelate decarboxylase
MTVEIERETELDKLLQHAVTSFGTPSFVYFTDPISQRIARLRSAFGNRFALSYAVKSNPNPALLEWLDERVEFLDVSSIGELRLAERAGWSPARASFTGPGKRDYEIRQSIESGLGDLVLESPREAMLASEMSRAAGRIQDVLIRIAPSSVPRGFGDQMAGRPSAFGFDVEQLDAELPEVLKLPNLRCVGLHIYSGTQCLRPAAICENYRTFLTIFRDVCRKYELKPRKLIFGSGLGIPYHMEDVPLDLDAVAKGIVDDLDALKREPAFTDARLVLELGRYLVGEAGYFLTRVISIKESRGHRIAICDGGMNNHLPASGHFGMVMHRNYRMHKVGGGDDIQKVDIVGPLCTSIDRLALGVMLPRLDVGDVIAVHNSGAYGLTASPVHFISHGLPVEILAEPNRMRDVTRVTGDTAPPERPAG